MKIYIPTHGRAAEPQPAYHQLDGAGLRPVLVVDKAEVDSGVSYKGYRTLIAPVKGIAQKRQFILEHAGRNKFMQIDDDMTLAAVDRTGDKVAIERYAHTEEVVAAVALAEELLDTYAHGGYHTRHFVNYQKAPYILNRGYYRQIMCFNPKLFGRQPVKYRGETAEDVDFMIQLLNRGLDYFIITSACMIEHVPRNRRKDWSHWTQEQKNKDMQALGAKYPNYVRPTKDGRITLSYSKILKDAKRRIHGGE